MAKQNIRTTKEGVKVTTVKLEDGSMGWRVRDENGVAVTPRFGRIHGIDRDAAGNAAAYKASVRVIERVLKRHDSIKSLSSISGSKVRKLRLARIARHDLID